MPSTQDILKESQAMLDQTNAQGSAPFAGSSYAITPSSLNQTSPVEPTVPAPTPTPVVPDFLQLSQPEQQTQDQYSGISQQIADLTGQLAGRDAYTTGQQAQQDVIGKQNAVSNYQSQLRALQQEGEGLNLQMQQDQQRAKLNAAGTGITTGILAAQQRGIGVNAQEGLLQNAIKRYSVGASLSAAQGDLTSALNYVDQAVKLKYQPIESQIAAQQANLQTIQNDPRFTEAQKKLAAQKEQQLKEYNDKISAEKENMKSIQALALQALQNGAPDVIVSKINSSSNLNDAMKYAVGYAQKETAQNIQEYNKAVSTGYKGSYTDFLKYQEAIKLSGKYAPAGKQVSVGGRQLTDENGKYKSDLDALIGNTYNIIPTKFGQESFDNAIKASRNDSDKLNTIASTVLKNSPAEIRNDFINQSVGVKQIEKAIKMLDDGAKTGAIQSGLQYTFNLAGKDFDPKLAAINTYITSAIQPYRNSVTGAAWGEQEDNEYQQLFGSTKYSPAELKARLERIKTIMTEKSSGALNAQVNPLGGSDQFIGSLQNKGNPQKIVEQAVQSAGKSYQQIINGAPKGQIAVVQDGIAGYIPVEEFDPNIHVRM